MNKLPLPEIIELYLDREMTMEQVADYFGVTKQAISYRLKAGGVQARRAQARKKPPEFEKAELEKLYICERLTVNKIAERLDSTPAKIIKAMNGYGIARRKAGSWATTRYPQLRKLKIGEWVDLPRKTGWLKPAVQYYGMAKKAGIRVSTRTIDQETMRVTRIE